MQSTGSNRPTRASRAGRADPQGELRDAIAASERQYRGLQRRLDDYDRRLRATRARLSRPDRPPSRPAPRGPHC